MDMFLCVNKHGYIYNICNIYQYNQSKWALNAALIYAVVPPDIQSS